MLLVKYVMTSRDMQKEKENLRENILPENRNSVTTEMKKELRIEY